MEKELQGALQDILLLLEEYGLENLRHPVGPAQPGKRKKGISPYEKGVRALELYREYEISQSLAEAKTLIHKVRQ